MTFWPLPGVVDVHDLHVWTLTSEMDVATVHLMTRESTDAIRCSTERGRCSRRSYRIVHATLQVEPDTHHGCAEVTW